MSTTEFLVRSDIFDSITPKVVYQRDISNPAGEWKPAPYLPVVWTATNASAGTDAFVISSGKPVCLDAQGFVVPAGLYWAATKSTALSDVMFTYTATDVTWKVQNIVTGAAVTAATTATVGNVAAALFERGLVTRQDVLDTQALLAGTPLAFGAGFAAADLPDAGTMTIDEAHAILRAFFSKPVGVASYDVFVWSGRPEDGDQKYTNYSKQHLIQFFTETQMIVPTRAISTPTTTSYTVASVTLTTSASAGDMLQATQVWSAAAIAATTRYSLMGATTASDLVAIKLGAYDIAANTSRTPITCSVAGVLSSEKSALTSVKKAGDFYVDLDVGVIFITRTAWDAQVAAASTLVFTFQHYPVASATTVASSARYVHLDGRVRPGTRLSVDSASNFCPANCSRDVFLNAVDLGAVMFLVREPRGMLEKVKTAFNLSNMPASGKMPGTATKGYSDMITLSQEEVSDQLAVILVRV